jgi:hypothetical protein
MMKNVQKKNVSGLALTALMVGAAILARRSTAKAWAGIAREEPPPGHDNRHANMSKAVTWAVASGAAVGLARLLVRRIVGYRGTPLG